MVGLGRVFFQFGDTRVVAGHVRKVAVLYSNNCIEIGSGSPKLVLPRWSFEHVRLYTNGEPQEMIKHCIQQPAKIEHKNGKFLLEQNYGNPHSILAVYRKEIKTWPQLKPSNGRLELTSKPGLLLIHQK